ncbi:MAG: hypothetical protein PHG81_09080 [Aliarcobacter sp.]|nr:hypothetical protein [Aliarcobacter sp.]
MSTIETYKQEIEKELDLALEKLVELKTKIRSLSDVERLDFIKDVESLETMANEMMDRVKEINVEMENSWEQIKGDVDSSLIKINEGFERLNRSLV